MIEWDNISIYFDVNDDKIGHDSHTDPVGKDVDAGEDFFDTAISVEHLNLESGLAVLSDEVHEHNQQHPAQENYTSYKELDTEQQGFFILIGLSMMGSMRL